MTDLLDLLGVDETAVKTRQRTGQEVARIRAHATDPRADWIHVCLPNMSYVCGGSIIGLPDGGPGGHMILGANEERWPTVTCPECRAPGRRAISRRTHLQQKPVGHQCPPLNQADNLGCRHWQTIPEGA